MSIESDLLNNFRERMDAVFEYCRPHLDKAWAVDIVALLFSTDAGDVSEIVKTFRPVPHNRPKRFEAFQDWIHLNCVYLSKPGTVCDKCGKRVPLREECIHEEVIEITHPGTICYKCGWFVPKKEERK
jgi:hypothetical protein